MVGNNGYMVRDRNMRMSTHRRKKDGVGMPTAFTYNTADAETNHAVRRLDRTVI